MRAIQQVESDLSIRIRGDHVRIVRRPKARDFKQAAQMAQFIAVQFRNLAESAGLDIGESLEVTINFTVPDAVAFEVRHPMFRYARVREIMRATAAREGDAFDVAS